MLRILKRLKYRFINKLKKGFQFGRIYAFVENKFEIVLISTWKLESLVLILTPSLLDTLYLRSLKINKTKYIENFLLGHTYLYFAVPVFSEITICIIHNLKCYF